MPVAKFAITKSTSPCRFNATMPGGRLETVDFEEAGEEPGAASCSVVLLLGFGAIEDDTLHFKKSNNSPLCARIQKTKLALVDLRDVGIPTT